MYLIAKETEKPMVSQKPISSADEDIYLGYIPIRRIFTIKNHGIIFFEAGEEITEGDL